MKIFRVLFLMLFLGSTMAMGNEVCEAINDLANDWNEVANFIDEAGDDDDFTAVEIRAFERYIEELAEDTYWLADALIDLGDRHETNLGTTLRKTMARLADGGSTNRMVNDLDSLVDTLDRVTDYCDE